jgi:triacylglycerol lipase
MKCVTSGLLALSLASVLISVLFLTSCRAIPPVALASPTSEYVILLHGLGRTNRSMDDMASFLTALNYSVINVDYPSRSYPVDILVRDYVDAAVNEQCANTNVKIHFVTHSLGGILTRYYLKYYTNDHIGRIVMLSPPNKGSEIPDSFSDVAVFDAVMGPTASTLGTGSNSVPNGLGPVNHEVGIITGDRSTNPFYSYIIPGKDDGKVSVDRAKVAGMKDFLVTHSSHTFIMSNEDVLRQTAYFLHHGKFDSTNSLVKASEK